MSKYIVELEPGVWVADIDGDPGRTVVEANAQRFERATAACAALSEARRYRPFRRAAVVKIESGWGFTAPGEA